MKKIALITFAMLLAAAVCPAQAKPASKAFGTPMPCRLSLAESPAFFGVRLDMTIADARKLFPRAGPKPFPHRDDREAALYWVYAASLPKNTTGMPVHNFEFFGPAKGEVEWLAIRFADKQTLTPEQALERVAGFTRIAPEMWQQLDNGSKVVVSWHAECNGFQLQFDAQKGSYYRLMLARNDYEKPADAPADGD